jgi:hypothetical protein
MIEVTDCSGHRHYLAPAAIASVSEAGTSSQWHGIRSRVRMFDGRTIEARDTVDEIAARLAKEAEES